MRTKKTICLGLLVSILSLLSCSNKDSVEIYGTISGKVTDSSTGNPISAVQVTLVPRVKTIQTTDDGSFSFSGLDEGNYTVQAQKEGYQPNHKDVRVVSGETTEVIITLKLINYN